MKFEKLLLAITGAALALVCIKFPVWGVIALERELDTYLVVSRETTTTIDEMEAALDDFGVACARHQEWERIALTFDMGMCEAEVLYRTCPYGEDEYEACFKWERDYPVESCADRSARIDREIEAATNDMYAAVARRKATAARTGWGLLTTMILGTQAYTHSTWLCAPAYATFSTQINMGFTPTYDSTS